MAISTNLSLWIMALAVCAISVATDAQNVPSCASTLVPCFASINATKPPASCCTPLEQTIKTQLECLCNLYTAPGLLEGYGVNVTEALTLPARCGISGDLSACSNGTAQSPGSSSAPSTPAGIPGKSNGEKIATTRFLGVVVILVAFTLF